MNGIGLTCDLCNQALNADDFAFGLTRDHHGHWKCDYSSVAEKHFCWKCAEDLYEAYCDYTADMTGEPVLSKEEE